MISVIAIETESLDFRHLELEVSVPLTYGADMENSQIIEYLIAAKTALRERGVNSLYMFGSRARDGQRDDSDVDLYFEKTPGVAVTLFDLASIKIDLERRPGRRVDIANRESTHPALRATIEREALKVF
ncbi:MAG TPA: nucleotidyltransferase domain-containing protein [Rhizobiaceae bacterium]|nr:nucleotidyltransferase domain-containing protein [Rhizobiaceae bacterium]